MQTVTDYTIVASKMIEGFNVDIEEEMQDGVLYPKFAKKVKFLIEKGWQPLGRPFTIFDNRYRWAQINQAMVKYTRPNE